jgi:hypothetical protein
MKTKLSVKRILSTVGMATLVLGLILLWRSQSALTKASDSPPADKPAPSEFKRAHRCAFKHRYGERGSEIGCLLCEPTEELACPLKRDPPLAADDKRGKQIKRVDRRNAYERLARATRTRGLVPSSASSSKLLSSRGRRPE